MTGTLSAIDLPFDEAIAYLRDKINMPSRTWTDVWQRANVRAFTVAGAATDALVADFRQEVAKALEQGTALSGFRSAFEDIVKRHGWAHSGTPGWRARIIFETNLSMAYSAGRYVQMSAPETLAAYPYWQYIHSGNAHPRKQHLAWNGLCLAADDPFWQTHYPPNGWGCGCRVAPVSESDLKRQGKSGPDKAPPSDLRDWSNPATGEVHQVPAGIDPGFDYNPGRQWLASRPDPSISPVDFPDLAAADRALDESMRGWVGGLSRAEVLAIDHYRGSAAFRINEQMRAGRILPPDQPMIEALTAALDRSALPYAVRVMRGEQVGTPNVTAVVGDVIGFPGFTSTTLDTLMAREQAADHLTIEFRLPKGYKGAYINHVPRSSAAPEFELLLQRAASFRVVDRIGNHLVLEPL